ncbi:MAG: DUF4412 domain-containing protein [Bacteroidales bacterium]|nr:DUF4412 domain-containing protein [Bacteroidales bacterium]
MKKIFMLAMMSAMFGIGSISAQSQEFEGEMTSHMYSMQKIDYKVKISSPVTKLIVKAILKKTLDKNLNFYNGTYNTTTWAKGDKTKTFYPYNNSYAIVEKLDGDKIKTTYYYPYINKGYYMVQDVKAAKESLEEMRKAQVEKTGETMTILGYKCDVYKVKYEMKSDSAGTVSETNLHNEFAICTDPSLPGANEECIPGVKGVPLKFTNNTVSQTTNEMLNFDFRLSIASKIESITPKSLDDSEFKVPAGINVIDGLADPKKMTKIINDNKNYMKKKGLWNEKDTQTEEIKVYDNLSEDWDY